MLRQSLILLGTALLAGCAANTKVQVVDTSGPYANVAETFGTIPKRIAFGSCMVEDAPKPVLDLATDSDPDLFIFLGDNIYGDTYDMSVLQAKYDLLGASPEFQRLESSTPILATWDDHDYGADDAGKEYPFKEKSKEIFLDFWKVPANSERRMRPGIYGEHMFEEAGRRLQVILLDTRTFRDELIPNTLSDSVVQTYMPSDDKESSILGAEQWTWLEAQLNKPADVRIVASSIQFSHEHNGWESWTNMPHERDKMMKLIRETDAGGVIFISGDVHWGEVSRQENQGSYPLWDITSSGITESWEPGADPNENRVGEAVAETNYGYIDIDWTLTDVELTFGLVDHENTIRIARTVRLSDLQ